MYIPRKINKLIILFCLLNIKHKTWNKKQHIKHLSFCRNKVSWKGIEISIYSSSMAMASYPDLVTFIHSNDYTSWTAFPRSIFWVDNQLLLTIFNYFDSYCVGVRCHYCASKDIKSSSRCCKVPRPLVVAIAKVCYDLIISYCLIIT